MFYSKISTYLNPRTWSLNWASKVRTLCIWARSVHINIRIKQRMNSVHLVAILIITFYFPGVGWETSWIKREFSLLNSIPIRRRYGAELSKSGYEICNLISHEWPSIVSLFTCYEYIIKKKYSAVYEQLRASVQAWMITFMGGSRNLTSGREI